MYIKGFDKDLRCRGMQFEVGKEYSTGVADADISLCTNTVFHFCDSLKKVHTYYSVIPEEDNRFCEIEVLGALVSDDTKCGSNRIRIVREILGDELNIMRGLTNGNAGIFNGGNWNSGDWNSGDWNSGDWNSCNHSSGCFNVKSNKIYFFDKPSNWTYQDWSSSVAKRTMDCVPSNLVWVEFAQMTDEEKESYPAAKATGGYLRKIPDDELAVIRNEWWARLPPDEKDEILKLPNFDKEIFKEITMIDVSNEAE